MGLIERDALKGSLSAMNETAGSVYEDVRTRSPEFWRLSRDEYDTVLSSLLTTKQMTRLGLDAIDDSVARLAREQYQDDLVAAEREAYGNEGP